METKIISPEEVWQCLKDDGSMDAMRLKIINQLKANEEFKTATATMVEQSKVLNTPGAEKQTRLELVDSLRRELETPLLEKTSKSVWDLILDDAGLGKELNETVEKVFCRLSGREPPLFPASTSEAQQQDKEKDQEDNNNQGSGSKKRTFTEMAEGEENTVSADLPAAS